jgi:hypothetical protein
VVLQLLTISPYQAYSSAVLRGCIQPRLNCSFLHYCSLTLIAHALHSAIKSGLAPQTTKHADYYFPARAGPQLFCYNSLASDCCSFLTNTPKPQRFIAIAVFASQQILKFCDKIKKDFVLSRFNANDRHHGVGQTEVAPKFRGPVVGFIP